MVLDPDAFAAPVAVDAPVGRRARWWPWNKLRRAGLAAVPVGARKALGRDAIYHTDVSRSASEAIMFSGCLCLSLPRRGG